MAKNKFLLVDLNEEKTKKISEIITSETSRRILDHLSEKEATEKEISEKLEMPISTVHYHLQKLVEAQLVVVEEFHYSPKGREVNHYKLANKYIIIAPKKVSGIKRALNNILPVGLIVLGISAIIKFVQKYSQPVFMGATEKAADNVFALEEAAAPLAADMGRTANETIIQSAPLVADKPDIAFWFLLGGFASLVIYLLVMIIKEKMK